MSPGAHGWVVVEAPWLEPAGDARIIDVRDHDLRLVERIARGTGVELDPGLYLASAALPSGERESKPFTVAPGEEVTVVLGPESAPRFEQPAEELMHSNRSLLLMGPEPSWWLRLVSAGTGKPASDPAALRREDSDWGPSGRWRISTPPGPETLIAQVARPGHPVWNVVLPVDPDGSRRDCTLSIRIAHSGLPRCAAAIVGGGDIEMLADYVSAGRVREAAEVGACAMNVLFSKQRDPVGAALGGYALLRLGRLAQHEDWVANLMEWFEWLPDGAVLAGELATAAGDLPRARECYDTALERGLPIFSDGLSLLVSHLRARRAEPSEGDQAARVLELALVARFGDLTPSFPDVGAYQPGAGAPEWEGPTPEWKELA